jgi:hypothetical protein
LGRRDRRGWHSVARDDLATSTPTAPAELQSAPQDAADVDALIWIVRYGGFDPEINRCVEQLARDHAGNKKSKH